jgi:hypothetical protein
MVVAVFVPALAIAARQTPAPQNALRDQIYSALTGAWTGQLEYRDYQSDERVVLPAWLEVKPAADGRALEFVYTYDDGPAKTVTESSTVAIDTTKRQFTITSKRDHSSEIYQIEGLAPLTPNGHLQFMLAGTGTENDQRVDVRIRITIDRSLYQFKKETRLSGKEFKFRDGYLLTRRAPVPGGQH